MKTGVSGAAALISSSVGRRRSANWNSRPAADHAHPLRRRRALGLLLEHPHRVGERRHAVPAQLHVVVEPAADQMHVRVVEARESPFGRRDRLISVLAALKSA